MGTLADRRARCAVGCRGRPPAARQCLARAKSLALHSVSGSCKIPRLALRVGMKIASGGSTVTGAASTNSLCGRCSRRSTRRSPSLCRSAHNEKQTGKVLLSIPFSVMAGLVPTIHVVRLGRGPKALPIGRQQRREGRCGGPTWMAGTSPAMTDRAAERRQPFHSRRSAEGRC